LKTKQAQAIIITQALLYIVFERREFMQAYEFYATPENGTIVIPEQYKNAITDEVMVIVLEKKPFKFNREEANARRKTDLLSPPFLDTTGWKFDREEANER
jgi:mannitol/fructose-specific phosphotransferase system IIA component (Ntr-type)